MNELVRFEVRQNIDHNPNEHLSVGVFYFFFNCIPPDSVINEKLNRIFRLSYSLPEPDYHANPSLCNSCAFFHARTITKFNDLIREWSDLTSYVRDNSDKYSELSLVRIEFDTSGINFDTTELLYQDEYQTLLHRDVFDRYKRYMKLVYHK